MRLRPRWLSCGLVLGAVLLAPTCRPAVADEVQQATYAGTLGPQRIGLILNMAGQQLAPSRYYYFRHLTDIPLTGEHRGGSFTLHEQAATITLHFVGNGSEHGQPLDFNNSIGLEGSWSDGKQTLPVRLLGGGLSTASPEGHWYESITNETDAVFEARTKGFCAAVAKGDPAEAARYTHFPLRVNHGPGKHELIGDAKQLAAQWKRLFTPAYIQRIGNASPHAMSIVQGYAMLGDGLVFFSDQGAEILNVP